MHDFERTAIDLRDDIIGLIFVYFDENSLESYDKKSLRDRLLSNIEWRMGSMRNDYDTGYSVGYEAGRNETRDEIRDSIKNIRDMVEELL